MGLNDRDYVRETSPGVHFQLPQSAVGLLIAINIGLYVLDALFDGQVSSRLAPSHDYDARFAKFQRSSGGQTRNVTTNE